MNLVSSLRDRSAYPHRFETPVVVHETHISWVFLAGDLAFKVKKPIKTDFLDYSTLDLRHHLCQEELRLDRRFTPDFYLRVAPITRDPAGRVRLDGDGETIEYAVVMRRFEEGALMSHRLEAGSVTLKEVSQLAGNVASFHADAVRSGPNQTWGSHAIVLEDARDNFRSLEQQVIPATNSHLLAELRQWSEQFAAAHQAMFSQRVADGFVRECHGDMHLENVIHWHDDIVPFDGIEFNDRFRWIDVLSDAAFLAMDFAARGHQDLCDRFIHAYLERTGDEASLPLLRWYLVYRALVRAKVAGLHANSSTIAEDERQKFLDDCRDHLDLAGQFASAQASGPWIVPRSSNRQDRASGSQMRANSHIRSSLGDEKRAKNST